MRLIHFSWPREFKNAFRSDLCLWIAAMSYGGEKLIWRGDGFTEHLCHKSTTWTRTTNMIWYWTTGFEVPMHNQQRPTQTALGGTCRCRVCPRILHHFSPLQAFFLPELVRRQHLQEEVQPAMVVPRRKERMCMDVYRCEWSIWSCHWHESFLLRKFL